MDVSALVQPKGNPKIPALAPGDTVKVSSKIVEGEKERIQVFQGVVVRIRHGGAGASFTVRRVTFGVGVERTFPLYSPLLDRVEVVRRGKVRRARLYYLRGLSARASRIKERRGGRGAEVPPELVSEEPVPEAAVPETAAPEASAPEAPPEATKS